MRYRALDADGDMTFGAGQANFLINSPAAVAQAIRTRLLLLVTEWFLDQEEGTPYQTQILGVRTQETRDAAIQDRILGTDGVSSIDSYQSIVDPIVRSYTVSGTVTTIFSDQPVAFTSPLPGMLYAVTDTGQQGVTNDGQFMAAQI